MKISERIAGRTKPFVSYEFFPPKDKNDWPKFFGVVEKLMKTDPLYASVTYGAGGSVKGPSMEIVTTLKKQFGLETMAHLTCLGASADSIAEYTDRLKDNGVDNILALRGDLPQDGSVNIETSPFKHAVDLVRFVRMRHPNFGIGVAGYPAPHPESPSFTSDWRYTVAKIREGADMVITQLFFDVREYFYFVNRLNDKGVSIPVIPGVLPVQSLDSIRRMLSLCGANIPGKLYLDLEAADKKGGVKAVREAGTQYAIKQINALLKGGAKGIHLYSLNMAETCLRIAQETGLAPQA